MNELWCKASHDVFHNFKNHNTRDDNDACGNGGVLAEEDELKEVANKRNEVGASDNCDDRQKEATAK